MYWVERVAALMVAGTCALSCAADDEPAASGGSGGTLGSGGVAGSGGGGWTTTRLGAMCTADAECDGLSCVTSLGDQGVPGGFCSIECGADASNPDAECTALRFDAICMELGPAGAKQRWCTEGCTVGVGQSCRDRGDVACFELFDPEGAPVGGGCAPICSNDAQCGSGLVCNGETNLCTAESDPGTLPLGSACDPTAAFDACAHGRCKALDGSDTGFCTIGCRLGTHPCAEAASSDLAGYCTLAANDLANQADAGFCAQLCNCDADCLHPDFVCNPDTWLEERGTAGYCFRASTDVTGMKTCPNP